MESNVIIDPQYEEKASGFLKKAVIGLVCASFPIASIVAIILGSGNHKAIVDYVGIGMTIFYVVYFICAFLMLSAYLFSTLPNQH